MPLETEAALLTQHGSVAKKRNEMLRRKRQRELLENQRRLDAWFDKFDTDRNGILDKDQLRALLLYVHPRTEVSDEALEALLKLGGASEAAAGVSRGSMQQVIDLHGDYARQQKFIDDAFAKFDTDGSGALDCVQLAAFLESLDLAVKVNPGDVDFVLQQADVGSSKTIERAELLPAVGVWRSLMATAVAESHKRKPLEIEAALLTQHGSVAKKRNEMLRRQRQRQLLESQRRLDDWFKQFDTDKNGVLDKEQLRALLLFIEPQTEVTDEALEKLFELGYCWDTTGDCSPDTYGISRGSMQQVIDLHGDYARQQKFIDDAFAKFDTDGSGALEQPQLAAFLDSLGKVKVDEGDVDFVLQQADVGGTNSISRDELLPAVGVWLALSMTPEMEAEAGPAPTTTAEAQTAETAAPPSAQGNKTHKSGFCSLL